MRRTLQVLARQPPLWQACDLLPHDHSIVRHLEKTKPAQVTVLSNGFRVATRDVGGETATVGIWIDAGSRFESWANNGVAHFLEHMTFKGTTSRTKLDIESFFEFTGGHLNAYTTREQTVYFVQAFRKDISAALDRLTDILRCPRLLKSDLESERWTIMKEKEDVELNVDEVMMDNVHLTCFPNDGLGMTILGLEENIKDSINVEMIKEYIRRHYTAKRMVMVGCGGVDHAELVAMAEKMWGDLPSMPEKQQLAAAFVPGDKVVEYDLASPNLTICWPTGPQSSVDHLISQIVQFYFGNWDRHAQDNQRDSPVQRIADELGTDAGQLESLQAFTTPYSDISLFGYYLVASPTATPEVFQKFQLDVIRRLLWALEKLTEEDVTKAKEALKISSLLLVDSTSNMADALGGQMLAHGRDIPLTEIYGRLDAITLDDVRQTIEQYIFKKPFVFTGVGKPEFFPRGPSVRDYLWQRDATFQPHVQAASA
ncbi:Ubiquinol-cytochrome-c reductase complex core protein I [Diplonema papillatum]|nr:Ubiquinol-cytochrome-c reductase complex core protein I [Diplonema papillatum]